MADTIVVRAPTRIDFGGGWTDVPPYAEEMGGYVCNVAITRYATVTLSRGGGSSAAPNATPPSAVACATPPGSAPIVFGATTETDQAIIAAAARRFRVYDAEFALTSDFPIGAGLGGSSAAGVASVAALAVARGAKMNSSAIAEMSREIETADLGIAGGRQDHYAAAYGGGLGLRFTARGVDVRIIPVGGRLRGELEKRCVVIYTGQSRVSGDTINAVTEAYRAREPGVVAALDKMKGLAERMADALAASNLDALGTLVGQHWTHQRALHPSISTPLIEEIIAKGMAAGGLGAKALGASGGGCVVIIAQRDRGDAVRKAVASLGQLLSFSIDERGVEQCP